MRRNRPIFLRLLLILAAALVLAGPSTLLAQDDNTLTHVVQPGENLYRIALRYGVAMDELARVNNITDQTRILVGQVLIIPGLADNFEAEAVVNPLVAGTPVTHVVQPGESLTLIAQQYGVTVQEILDANNIPNPNRIFRGQELTIWTTESVNSQTVATTDPAAAEAPGAVPTTGNMVYIVQAGERLSQIAQRYGISWPILAQVNNIANPDLLYAGQEIIIPALNAEGGVTDLGILSVPAVNAPPPTITVGKQVVVDLSDQRVFAYDNGALVYTALASTGLPATPTVVGDFTVYLRLRSQTMSGPGYNLPNVEWVQYFFQGYALHGTYWHNNFGQPMSHGCVNLTNADAQWFYEWATMGTPVHVQY